MEVKRGYGTAFQLQIIPHAVIYRKHRPSFKKNAQLCFETAETLKYSEPAANDK